MRLLLPERRRDTQRMIDRGHTTPRTDISDSARLAFATVVHAAAALYLGLGGRDLRDVLAMGFSLADAAERRGESSKGLEQAISGALRRTADCDLPAPAVDHILKVAEEGWSRWQATVEQLIAMRRPRGWRAAIRRRLLFQREP